MRTGGARNLAIRGGVQLATASIATRGLNLVLLALIARNLGLHAVAVYAIAIVVGTYAQFASDLGSGQRLVRVGGYSPNRLLPELEATIGLKVMTTGIIAVG